MEKRRLGRTGLEVTIVGFGALPIQRCDMREAVEVLNAALDSGINFVDTARGYTDSEQKIGAGISGRRKEFILATKSFQRSFAGMTADIDKSLSLMKTDYIDLYQVHNIKRREELEAVMAPGGALEALQAAKQAGKIGHIGVTGHNIDLLVEAIQTDAFATVQVPFNTVEREALDRLFPLAKQKDIGRIVMKPMGGGLLASKNLALRFILGHDVTVAIPGMDKIDHVTQNVSAASPFIHLSPAEHAELTREAEELGKGFCRRCGYCMPCTKGIDIPTTFIFHHQYKNYGMGEVIPARYQSMPAKASDCIACGVCETRCPYDIPIMERMKKIAAELG